ncbi:MAG: hypothetical protein ABWW69_00240 [Pyrodictiaceae archaeon]
MGTSSLPYFATGELVGDYSLLYAYWRKAGNKAERAVLRSEDFERLRLIVEREGVERLDELWEKLTDYFMDRVDGNAAVEAVKERIGVVVDAYTARRMIARILAGWLIEAGKQWKLYSFRGAIPRD